MEEVYNFEFLPVWGWNDGGNRIGMSSTYRQAGHRGVRWRRSLNRKKGERRRLLADPLRFLSPPCTSAFTTVSSPLMPEQISPTTPRVQSNLTKSFPLFLDEGKSVTRERERKGQGRKKPYAKIRLEKLYEGQL